MASPAGPAPAPGTPAWRGPAVARLSVLLAAVAAAAASAAGAWLGAWWVPFPVGVAAGTLRAAFPGRWRGIVAPAVVGATGGWLLPLWVLALRGQPAGATARAVAALVGLPPYAGVTLAAVALVAAVQALAGAWLARAAFRRDPLAPAPGAGPAPGTAQPAVTQDPRT